MNPDEIVQLKGLLEKLWRWLDQIEFQERNEAALNAINSNMLRLLYRDKDAFTLKEVSERTNIPVQQLYRYEKQGLLKTISRDGIVKLVMQEDIINFLKTLRNTRL
jgi:hypothetical protein